MTLHPLQSKDVPIKDYTRQNAAAQAFFDEKIGMPKLGIIVIYSTKLH
jgi:hypothetical protein